MDQFYHSMRCCEVNTSNCSTDRPRLVRLISPANASVHDLILVDSPKFHIILDFAINVEVYHLTIRGANLGSYDGIDAIGTNYWIHDNEVCISSRVFHVWPKLTYSVGYQSRRVCFGEESFPPCLGWEPGLQSGRLWYIHWQFEFVCRNLKHRQFQPHVDIPPSD